MFLAIGLWEVLTGGCRTTSRRDGSDGHKTGNLLQRVLGNEGWQRMSLVDIVLQAQLLRKLEWRIVQLRAGRGGSMEGERRVKRGVVECSIGRERLGAVFHHGVRDAARGL